MGIDLRCAYRSMPQKLLNRPEVLISLQQVRCKGMPEHMRCDLVRDPGMFHGGLNRFPDVCQWLSGLTAGKEQRAFVLALQPDELIPYGVLCDDPMGFRRRTNQIISI